MRSESRSPFPFLYSTLYPPTNSVTHSAYTYINVQPGILPLSTKSWTKEIDTSQQHETSVPSSIGSYNSNYKMISAEKERIGVAVVA